jgi:Uncharacterised protein family (UPF0158)
VTSEQHNEGTESGAAQPQIPASWDALEAAFENNAPDIHSYLHLGTGEVVRLIDGAPGSFAHTRIARDVNYRRVEPVASREQYNWMVHFVGTVEDVRLRRQLMQALSGKGAFRRFRDELVSNPVERERWFEFRSARLRMCMEYWLEVQKAGVVLSSERRLPAQLKQPATELASERRSTLVSDAFDPARARARVLIEALSVRDLKLACAFLAFLARRGPYAAARRVQPVDDEASPSSPEVQT